MKCTGIALWVTFSAIAAGALPAQAKKLELSFGVYTSDKATTMYRMFVPVMEHLQGRIEKELRQPVDIELRIFKTYDAGIEALVKGKVDFVRFGPASYVLARSRNRGIRLLGAELKNGKRSFRGMIVVRRDSPIRKLADLRQRSFAFGDRNSTIGRYLAQAVLLGAGLHGKHMARYQYLGSHDRVFRAVEHGDFDAGSLKERTFKKLNKRRQLRVLTTFDNATKPWIARAGLEPRVFDSLRRALLGTRAKAALKTLKVDGFVAAEPNDYAKIKASMERARAFAPPRPAPRK